MRILSLLAKGGSSGSGKKKEDTFGMKDEDWDIYKAVSKVDILFKCFFFLKHYHHVSYFDWQEGGGSDSEAEQEKLNDLEAVLKRYDPNFKNYGGSSGLASGEGGSGCVPTAEHYQLHIGTERIRAPEIFFQPSLIGYTCLRARTPRLGFNLFFPLDISVPFRRVLRNRLIMF